MKTATCDFCGLRVRAVRHVRISDPDGTFIRYDFDLCLACSDPITNHLRELAIKKREKFSALFAEMAAANQAEARVDILKAISERKVKDSE